MENILTPSFEYSVKPMLLIFKIFGIPINFSKQSILWCLLNRLLTCLLFAIHATGFFYNCSSVVLENDKIPKKIAIIVFLYFTTIYLSNISTLICLNFKGDNISTLFIKLCNVDTVFNETKLNQIYINTRSQTISYFAILVLMLILNHCGMYLTYYFDIFKIVS
ncbi:hypothetical protein L9F63_020506, partial [Diploptera punctata]